MTSTVAAPSVPLSAASTPPQAVSSPMAPANARTVTVPVTPAYNAITVQLQPVEKATNWLDPTILGPLVSALAIAFSYIGTAKNTNKQLKAAREAADRQMQNASDQSRQDRTFQSRKAIFDTFIDDFKRCAHLLGDLPSRGSVTTSPDIEELSAINATVNKIWLWAEVETVYEVRSLQADINELFFDCIVKCKPIWQIQRELERIGSVLLRHEVEQDACWKQIREFKPGYDELQRETNASQRRRQFLEGRISHATSAIAASSTERAEHAAEELKLRNEYLTFLSERQPQLMDKLTQLMGRARNELGVQGDVSILNEQTEEMKNRAAAAIRRVQSKLSE